MNTLGDVWKEFSEPWVEGLVSNIIMVFPNVKRQGVLKEVNLSAWESDEAAYEWYVKSPGHQDTLLQHTSGMFQTFGNLLCSLEHQSSTSFEYEDRCKQCLRPVPAPKLGEPPPTSCSACGGPTFNYPLF